MGMARAGAAVTVVYVMATYVFALTPILVAIVMLVQAPVVGRILIVSGLLTVNPLRQSPRSGDRCS